MVVAVSTKFDEFSGMHAAIMITEPSSKNVLLMFFSFMFAPDDFYHGVNAAQLIVTGNTFGLARMHRVMKKVVTMNRYETMTLRELHMKHNQVPIPKRSAGCGSWPADP